MSNSWKEEYFKEIGKINLERDDEINDTEYELDEKNSKKFLEVKRYCETLVEQNNGTIENIITRKKNLPAEIQLRFMSDLIIGDDTNSAEEFTNILSLCDAINIGGTGLEDGSFLISFFIKNLYKPKKI